MTKKFEELLEELRVIMRKIEDPETGLDESIELYEKGAVLIRLCEEVLTKAELKITELGAEET
ncbi:MAG: exodeoxyribonuclease VII small subunit [Methanomicrobiales archaeon]|nr:exodeoxyribonuclease VII small subunit [Methanomicrobiales archaeon]